MVALGESNKRALVDKGARLNGIIDKFEIYQKPMCALIFLNVFHARYFTSNCGTKVITGGKNRK